jgi:hypothetical protein
MIYRTTILVMFALAALVMAKAAEPRRDVEIKARLVGTWNQDVDLRGFEGKATTTYLPDGKLSGEGIFSRGKRSVKLVVTGSWKLEDAKLTETVETCQPPLIRRGRQLTSEIMEVNDAVLRYLNEQGEERTKMRVTQ